jgi:hypothetical protein
MIKNSPKDSQVEITKPNVIITKGAALFFADSLLTENNEHLTYLGFAAKGQVMCFPDLLSMSKIYMLSLSCIDYIETSDIKSKCEEPDMLPLALDSTKMLADYANRSTLTLFNFQSLKSRDNFRRALRTLIDLADLVQIQYEFKLRPNQLYAMANLRRSHGANVYAEFRKDGLVSSYNTGRTFTVNKAALV